MAWNAPLIYLISKMYCDFQTIPTVAYLKMAEEIKAIDYVKATKQRCRTNSYLKTLFKSGVDAIVCPTSASCAPYLDDADLPYGAVDAEQDNLNMRLVVT